MSHRKRCFYNQRRRGCDVRSWFGMRKNQLLDIDTFYRWRRMTIFGTLFNGGTGLLLGMPVAVITRLQRSGAGLIISEPDTLNGSPVQPLLFGVE